MNPQTLDYLAIGLALGGIVLRLTGKPWFASILCSVSPCCVRPWRNRSRTAESGRGAEAMPTPPPPPPTRLTRFAVGGCNCCQCLPCPVRRIHGHLLGHRRAIRERDSPVGRDVNHVHQCGGRDSHVRLRGIRQHARRPSRLPGLQRRDARRLHGNPGCLRDQLGRRAVRTPSIISATSTREAAGRVRPGITPTRYPGATMSLPSPSCSPLNLPFQWTNGAGAFKYWTFTP